MTGRRTPLSMNHDKPEYITGTVRRADLIKAIELQAKNQRITCMEAASISSEFGVSLQEAGKLIDEMNHRITHCQLGLFGYIPEKKIIYPEKSISSELKSLIENFSQEGKISCEKAWVISSQLKISKLSVGNACEGLGLRIKPCQLGAF